MQKRTFKSAAKSRRFKDRGQGLRVAESRLRDQQKSQVDAIELAKLQSKEASKNFISGLSDSLRFEEGVLAKKQKLEGEVRQHKYEALSKKADTDVKRLEGEFQQKKEYASWINDLAPKFAKNLGKLARVGFNYVDFLRGQKQWEALEESGILDDLIDQEETAEFQLLTKVNRDGFKLDPDERNALHRSTFKVSTSYASKRLAKWFKENRNLIKSDAIDTYRKLTGVDDYGESNAVDVQKFNAHLLLDRIGLSRNSRGGKEIIQLATQIGVEERYQLSLVRKNSEWEDDMQTQLGTLNTEMPGSDKYNLNFNELVVTAQNGYIRTRTGISDPNTKEGKRSLADGYEVAGTYLIDNNFKNIRDVRHLREILKVSIPDTGTGEKGSWTEKHPERTEKLVQYYLNKQKKFIKEKAGITASEDIININNYDDAVANEAWKNEKQEDDEGNITWVPRDNPITKEQWDLEQIRAASELKTGGPDSRNYIFNQSGLNPIAHDSAQQYIRLNDYFNSNNPKQADSYWAGLPEADKRRLLPYYERGKLLQDYPNAAKGDKILTGSSALLYDVDGLFRGIEKNHANTNTRLHASAAGAKTLFYENVVNRATAYGNTPKYKGDPAGAWKAAFDAEKIEFDKGLIEYDAGGKRVEKDYGIYARTDAIGGKTGQTQYIYERWDTSIVPGEVDQINFFENQLKASKDGTLKTAQSNLANMHITPMNATQMNEVLTLGLISPKDLVKQPTFISPDVVSSLAEDAKIRTKVEADALEGGYEVDTSKIPLGPDSRNVAIYAKARGLTYGEALNQIFEFHGKDARWPTDSQDQAKINNGGKVVNPRNEQGYNAYNAFKNQGFLPKSKINQEVIDNSINYGRAFRKVHGISWERRDGEKGVVFTDLNKFLEVGGINALIAEGVGPEFLQEIGFVDQYEELDHLPTQQEALTMRKQGIFPTFNEYRRILDRRKKDKFLLENNPVAPDQLPLQGV